MGSSIQVEEKIPGVKARDLDGLLLPGAKAQAYLKSNGNDRSRSLRDDSQKGNGNSERQEQG
jgi:hypothetical protein